MNKYCTMRFEADTDLDAFLYDNDYEVQATANQFTYGITTIMFYDDGLNSLVSPDWTTIQHAVDDVIYVKEFPVAMNLKEMEITLRRGPR